MSDQRELSFRSYYLDLKPTGVYEVDVILSAVARAGKSFHSTEGWVEDGIGPEEPFEGEDWNDRIQNAGVAAANALAAKSEALRIATEALEGSTELLEDWLGAECDDGCECILHINRDALARIRGEGVRDDDPMHVAPRGDGVTQRKARLDATDDREEEQVVVERTALVALIRKWRERERRDYDNDERESSYAFEVCADDLCEVLGIDIYSPEGDGRVVD